MKKNGKNLYNLDRMLADRKRPCGEPPGAVRAHTMATSRSLAFEVGSQKRTTR